MNIYNDTIGYADNSNITGRFARSWKEIHGRELRSWEFEDSLPRIDRHSVVAFSAILAALLIGALAFRFGG